ncbi:MAG: hypothetical protein QOD81_675 [Solirubrobacteraceae bacterium]|jgi:hypothetical protein|nr:hypothetical protein [Solirubrobacteraceae bacterium]
MVAPSTLEQQLAASWQAARLGAHGGGRAQRTGRRRRLFRVVRAPR